MNQIRHSHRRRPASGFTLVEMITVVGIIALMIGVSLTVVGNTGAAALKTAGENLTAVVEQGRTSAITRRREVALAVLKPGQGGFDDGQCRIGLFELDEDRSAGEFKGRLLRRWLKMPGGIAFFGGEVDSLSNLMDEETIRIEWKDGNESVLVHALVFTPRGGLSLPRGSESIVVKIGRGTYQNGKAVKFGAGANRTIRIGRVVARPWIIDA